MFDELRSAGKGTFDLGGGRFEFETAARSDSDLRTIWVHTVHWPRCCECEGAHVPISFGQGLFGSKFVVAHLDFWMSTDLEVQSVEAEINAWLTAGDLPDWVTRAQL